MIMKVIAKIKTITIIGVLLIMHSCSLAPGMHLNQSSIGGEKFVYIESLDEKIKIENIADIKNNYGEIQPYKIGNGDQIAITVWGLPEIFPVSNINPDQNLRRVDSNGNIYFPYIGITEAANKTQNELRSDLTKKLAASFKDPQLDVTIARFNSQKVYLLGEVTKPIKLNITDIPLSLSEALGESFGLNTNTAQGSGVFIIRQSKDGNLPKIYSADLSSPSGFIDAGNFYLADDDIVYVNAKSTTRWNKVISQFFPFSTFLSSVNQLTAD